MTKTKQRMTSPMRLEGLNFLFCQNPQQTKQGPLCFVQRNTFSEKPNEYCLEKLATGIDLVG